MRRIVETVCLAVVCLAVTMAAAQMAPKEKPPVYTYVAQWSVPRPQWADMVKNEEQEKTLLDKLVADGTLVGYGAYSNLIHQEGEPTHGSWMTATSEGNLLKALEAIYAVPGQTTSPAQSASKHWDQILTGTIYGSHPGSSTGYLTWSSWIIKPGEMQAFDAFTKSTFVPVLEKLLADGTITSYGLLGEDYHTQQMGTIYEYFTVPDAASMDKANKALEDAFDSNPSIGPAIRGMANREGHRDYLTRIQFMMSK